MLMREMKRSHASDSEIHERIEEKGIEGVLLGV